MTAVLAALAASGASAAATVTPSGTEVPENLLRIELHLRHALPRALSMQHVRLVDEGGETVDGAFLDLPLPAGDGRTITLLMDPGRVKSGVGANRVMGRALRAGHEVELIVDDPQLPAPIHKRWRVTPARREALETIDWDLVLPAVRSRRPLQVRVNSALASSGAAWLAVRGADGKRISGRASLQAGETRWEFVPDEPWRTGRYALVVHARLEDVAGNRPGVPFESAGLSGPDSADEERAFELLP